VTVVYSPRYHVDIGTHVFPTAKYHLLADRIRSTHPDAVFLEPEAASWDDLARVHTDDYLRKLQSGDFDLGELAQLEIPWSPDIVEGFRLMTGGTVAAARKAVDGRDAGALAAVFHIGGGFHHAFANHGEGFCLFNDVAVALRCLLDSRAIARAAVIDLDVHHGNGTAFIFGREPRVFTFSMHQELNYPAFKPRGSLDVGLPDGAGDELYLDRLAASLPRVVASEPDLVCYLAGADPFVEDQLGGLSLTKNGLRARDRMVLGLCAERAVPVVVLLAGGYARRLEDTVDVHYGTFDEVLQSVPPQTRAGRGAGTASRSLRGARPRRSP
jgi:acetoin utilization deacetylase AcuC-like enzyme